MPRNPKRVFVCYSRADERWLGQIKGALKPILDRRGIELWYDTQIPVGDDWRSVIDSAIAEAGLALLLMSHNFLASDFITSYELPRLLQAARNEGLIVLWIAVSDSNFASTDIERVQALNDPSQPLDLRDEGNRNRDLRIISEKFEAAAERAGNVKPRYDPAPYIQYLRQQIGLIELSRISDTTRNDVPIDELWVPSKVRVGATEREGPKASRLHDRIGEAVVPIDEAVNQNRLLLIRGEAGSGKSLLLKRIAYSLVRQDRESREKQLTLDFKGLPLWVQISALDKFIENHATPTLRENDPQWVPHFFADLANKKGWKLDCDFFANQLQDSEAILLLDGVDEASSSHGRTRVGQLFKKAAEEFRCRIIVTTRPEAGIQLPAGQAYAFADLQELDDGDIAQFVAHWSRSVASADADQLNHNLQKLGPRSDLRKLARNPQMLTILAILSHGNRLPEHRAAALEQIVTALAASRYHSHLEAETFIERISYLALGMILRPSGKYQIEIESAAAEIMPALFPGPAGVSRARHFLEEAQIKSGIVTLRGSGNLVFSHKLFQEYLAAKGLTNEMDALGGGIQVLRERQSPEVIRFLPGKSISGNNRIKGVIKGLIEDALKKDLEAQAYLAGIVSSMVRDGFELGESGQECYDELLRQVHRIYDKTAAASVEVKIRVAAADALAQGGQTPPCPTDEKEYWVRIEGTKSFRRGAQAQRKEGSHFDPEAYDQETPPPKGVPIATFDIGRYPVTVHEYQNYLNDETNNKGVKPPNEWVAQVEHPSRPVVYVSWNEARDYCIWASAVTGRKCRLLTEDEWEYAARGNELRRYPWPKESPTIQHANFWETGLGEPSPVGLFPAGATPEGVLDMAGNVWEWTASAYGGIGKTLRGGAFSNPARYLRAAVRDDNPPGGRSDDIGFRCLREVPVP